MKLVSSDGWLLPNTYICDMIPQRQCDGKLTPSKANDSPVLLPRESTTVGGGRRNTLRLRVKRAEVVPPRYVMCVRRRTISQYCRCYCRKLSSFIGQICDLLCPLKPNGLWRYRRIGLLQLSDSVWRARALHTQLICLRCCIHIR